MNLNRKSGDYISLKMRISFAMAKETDARFYAVITGGH